MAEKYHLAQQVGWLFPRYRALCGKKYWPSDADLGARGARSSVPSVSAPCAARPANHHRKGSTPVRIRLTGTANTDTTNTEIDGKDSDGWSA